MTKARDIASAIPAPSTVSSAELGYLDGVTSAIQTQLDAKAPSSTAVTLTGTQTLTNKTLTSPVIDSVVNNTLTSTTGDMIYASGANTPARLGIGSTGNVLTVAGGIPSWAAPAGGGGYTLLASGSLSGASVDLTSISQSYVDLYLILNDFYGSSNAQLRLRPNSETSGYNDITMRNVNNVTAVERDSNGGLQFEGQQFGTTDTDNSIHTFIRDYTNTTSRKLAFVQGFFLNDGSQQVVYMANRVIPNTSAITSILIARSNGNWSGGTYKLYGVK